MSSRQTVNIHSVWEDVSVQLPINLKAAKEAVISHLKKSQRDISLNLLAGRHHVDANGIDVKGLVDEIVAQRSKGLRFVRDQIMLLGLVIEEGNQRGLWKLPLPPVPVYVEREKNPFIPDKFKKLQPGRLWAETVLESLRNENDLTDKGNIGRILLSAISRGGLLNIATIDTLLAELHKPLFVSNGRSFVDLSLRWRGMDDMEVRRWFPDPLTEALILKNGLSVPVKPRERAWPYINAFLKEAGLARKDRPKNMTALIDAIGLSIKLRIPPFLANYASRSFVSHSLKHHVWRRLQGSKFELADSSIGDVKETKTANVTGDDELPSYGDTSWGRSIKSALRQPKKRLSIEALRGAQSHGHEADWPSIAVYLIGWAEHLLKVGSKSGRKPTIGTTRGYLGMIGSRIYGLVGEEDLALMNVEAFEEIYGQILEDAASAGMRRKLARTLSEFHYYLSLKHDVPDIEGSVLGIGSALAPVDANIISIEEFDRTLEILDEGDLVLVHPEMPRIAKLISIIAFRCGLRRSEVLKLRLIDLQGKIEPEILVRPHATRRLKTKNSTRRVLLDCLLEKDELKELLAWTDMRRGQEQAKQYSPYLFSIPEKQYAYVPEELVFPAIHRAMRAAAGDNTLRFHHFRHSCASWNLLRLLIADHGMPTGFFEHMPKTCSWLSKSGEFKQSLYRHDNPTRKHLFAIASILGHSSPDITLEHYIHWCDLMYRHISSRVIERVDVPLWVKVTNMPQATVFRWFAQDGEQAVLEGLRKNSLGRFIEIDCSCAQRFVEPEKDGARDVSLFSHMEVVWKLLYLHSNRHMPIGDLSERYGFTVKEAVTMAGEAKRIAAICGKDRHRSFRHRMMKSDSGDRLICPHRPRDAESIKLAINFSEKLSDLMLKYPDECNWLMEYYLNNVWSRSNDLIFRTPLAASRFLEILKKLSIPEKYVRLIWYHGRGLSGVSDSARRKYWRENLELPRNRRLETKQLNGRRLGEYGWIGIRLLDYLNADAQNHSSYGYRYSLVMFSIVHAAKAISTEKQMSLVL